MTHCFLLECCTKTHIDDLSLYLCICIFSIAFCQRFIYEYMDMDMEKVLTRRARHNSKVLDKSLV